MSNSTSYRAVQAVRPGVLELTRKELHEPGDGQVRIRVEACGICHSDAATVEGTFPIEWPRVPGHEAIGKIDAIGPHVGGWKIGQRVGVGFLAGHCGFCKFCRLGDFVHCANQPFTGVHHDGGYAEVLIAQASGLISVPDELSSVDAAPLVCAGLTTFSALRNASAKAGDLVGIIGIGGLGHLAVQYARHMGFEVVAIARGADKESLSRQLGAHHFIDSAKESVDDALQNLGGAQVILNTASSGQATRSSFKGLRPGGTTIVLGASPEDIALPVTDMIAGSRQVRGALTGSPGVGDATLRFSVLTGAKAMIETAPLENAPEAYAKMMSGKARFRMVLVMT